MNSGFNWTIDDSQQLLTLNKHNTYVVAANHIRSSDPFFVIAGLHLGDAKKLFPIRFMTYHGYYFNFFIRPFAFLAGCFPTRAARPRIPAGVEGAVKLLGSGSSVLIFPEGKRVKDKNQKAHTGLERIITQTDENVGLILAHIDWTDKKTFTITYKLANELKNRSSQEILDAIYAL